MLLSPMTKNLIHQIANRQKNLLQQAHNQIGTSEYVAIEKTGNTDDFYADDDSVAVEDTVDNCDNDDDFQSHADNDDDFIFNAVTMMMTA